MVVRAEHIGRLLTGSSARSASLRVYVLCALGLVAFWPAFDSLIQVWRDTADYQHGYAIAAISIGWLVLLRRRIESTGAQPSLAVLPALLLAIVTWLVAYSANSQMVEQLIAPAAILLAVYAASGRQVALLVAPPLAYLYFAVPIWEQLVPLLQRLTTVVAESALGLLHVPTVVAGNTVTIPEGTFQVVEGCSGKRYLLVGLAFATVAGVTQGLHAARIAVLLTSAVVLALITNWLRVIIIIYAGHVSNMEHYLVAEEHLTFGWLVFVPLLVTVSLLARRLGRSAVPSHHSGSSPLPSAAHSGTWLLVVALLLIPLFVTLRPAATFDAPRLGRMPIMVDEWQGPLPGNTSWQPHYVTPADERRAAYASSEGEVQVYVNVYGAQTAGHELIFFGNSVAPTDRWKIVEQLAPRDGLVTMLVSDATNARWAIAQTYSVGSRLTHVPVLAQLYYGVHALWSPVPSGTIALAAPCSSECHDAVERIHAFWRDRNQALVGLMPSNL